MRKSGAQRGKAASTNKKKKKKKTAWGALRERVRVSVENTKLLSDGEQMSDCHCACILLSNTGLGRRTVNGHLVAVGIKRDRQFCQIFMAADWFWTSRHVRQVEGSHGDCGKPLQECPHYGLTRAFAPGIARLLMQSPHPPGLCSAREKDPYLRTCDIILLLASSKILYIATMTLYSLGLLLQVLDLLHNLFMSKWEELLHCCLAASWPFLI